MFKKEIARQKNKIAHLRRFLKWAERDNIIGLSYFRRRANEAIKARQEIIAKLRSDNEG